MVLEDSQDNAEAVETLDSTPARSAPETTPVVSAGATVARYASARFPRPMVSPQLRDKPMSNSLDKILALVSTQLLQKADKNNNIPMQMKMQQQQQQQQIQQNMMSIMSSMLNHGTDITNNHLNYHCRTHSGHDEFNDSFGETTPEDTSFPIQTHQRMRRYEILTVTNYS